MKQSIFLMLILILWGTTLGVEAANLDLTKEQLMVGMTEFFPNMALDTKPQCHFYGGTYRPDDFRMKARYLINPECPISGEKIESPGIISIMLYVPIRREWSEDQMLPYKVMLSTALKNAIPEWTNEDERNEWLTKSMASLVETSDPKYSDITNNKDVHRNYARKHIRLSVSAGMINLYVSGF
jgi:hypothetical protein